MRAIHLVCAIFLLLSAVGFSSCSNDEYDPNDYTTSILSGNYEKDGVYKLYVTENGEPLSDYGSVRFDSDLKKANIRFVKVIPGVASKEFKNIPLVGTDDGITFTIDFDNNGKTIVIKGIVDLGKMTVDIKS